jgi:outer membrane murein-binding lipoprotein Lpp
MKGLRNIVLFLLIVGSAAVYSGCSSGPSADELAQLDQLKSEVESLKKEVAAKEAEKTSLEAQVQQKKDDLATAENNQKLTQERLKSQQ